MPDFLSEQIAQRISVQFREEGRKKYFKVDKAEGKFLNDTFILEYAIQQIAKPDKEIDIKKEILNTVTYCIKTYEFKDFSLLELTDLVRQDKLILNKAAIWARPTE